MLHLFEPMVLQQTLKLSIYALVVFDAINIMGLDHPFDMQRCYRNCQRIVGQNGVCYRFWWPYHLTLRTEALCEFDPKPFEQLDVLGFFARKLQQSTNTIIITL